MTARISRRSLAEYYAGRVLAGDDAVVARQLAAYLIDTRRTKELSLIVRDIEDALAARGVLVADVVSAHDLDTETEQAISGYLSSLYDGKVTLRTSVQPDVIGGVRIRTPDAELDVTVRRKLMNLQAIKI